MADNYLSFNYNNPNFTTEIEDFSNKLSDFGGFIINEGNDLKFFNPSNFSHEFMTPQFGKQSYFLGTTRENREFNFSILLKGITLDTYREFLRWLNPEEEGILSFDYSPNYGYDVKVNSISEATFYVTPNCSDVNNPTYDIELEVGFITKNDWAARWLPSIHTADLIDFSEISNYVNNDMGQNYIEFSDSKYFKKIQSVGQASYYSLVSFIYEGDTITGVTDSDNEITLRADDYSVGYPLRISYNSTSYYFEVAQKYLLTNYNNLPNYYKLNYHITATERCSFSINVDDMDIYKIEFSADGGAFSGTIYTQYGIAIDNNENFKNMIISDVLYLKPKESKTFYITTDGNIALNSFTIEPTSREII